MSRRLLPISLLALALACSEHAGPPTAPEPTVEPVPDFQPPAPESSERGQLEALARQMALALASPEFRAELRQSLDQSPVREHKLVARDFLASRHGLLTQAAQASAVEPGQVSNLIDRAIPAELYFPVPGHRELWSGGTDVLVATALKDDDAPVAFDTQGRRLRLDPDRPPSTPVLALVPLESHRPRMPNAKCLTAECIQPWGGGGGGGGSDDDGPGGPGFTAGSLTLTHAEFAGDFEGWFKGDPEYELHILGPVSPSDTSTMVSYQCVGEHAPPDYYWDMNRQSWDGQAKVFSYAQMDAFDQAFPGRAYLVFALEDDTDACVITSDGNQFKNMLELLGQAYNQYTAAKDRKIGFNDADRVLTAAQTAADLLAAIGNFFTTRDDAIGIAVETSVAGRFRPGSNWVVLDEDNSVTGWLNLEMR